MPASVSQDIRDTSAISVRPAIDSFPIACRVPATPAGFCRLTIARATAYVRPTSPGTFAIDANRDTLHLRKTISTAACPVTASTRQIAAPLPDYRTAW